MSAAARPYVSWYEGARTQTWQTPPEIFDRLHDEFAFTLDGAATSDNALLPEASTADAPRSWAGERVFCNPPWSIKPKPKFVGAKHGSPVDCVFLIFDARVGGDG